MILTLCNLKGGVGKTTLAVSIAGELHRRNNKVLLVDADPQGSAQKWRKKSENEEIWPSLIGFTEPILHKKSQIPSLSEAYDFTVIDTPPFDGGMTSSALLISDFALIPISPSGLDLEELKKIQELIEKAKIINESLQSAIVISRKIKGTVIGQDLRDYLKTPPLDQLSLLKAETHMRTAYPEVTISGDLLHVYSTRSKATHEIEQLTDEVLKQYG